MLKIDILTLFPDMFLGPFDQSMLLAAKTKGLTEINIHNLRDWSNDKHKSVDDRTYGGGKGMIIRVDVVDRALRDLKLKIKNLKFKIILLDAGGEKFTQKKARQYSKLDHLILIAGHYEGVDYRVREHLVDDVISIGDYVLTGGEIPAMVIADAVVRLIPGVLDEQATEIESHSKPGVVEFPQYTRPEEYNGWRVPEILLSGHHGNIQKWREENLKKNT